MLVSATLKITKEQYEDIQKNGLDESKYFCESLIWGYGIYGARAVATKNGYEIRYERGSSCD